MKIEFLNKTLWRAFRDENASAHFASGYMNGAKAEFLEESQKTWLPEGIDWKDVLNKVDEEFTKL